MTVSIEVITIVASAATLLVAVLGGFAWVVSHLVNHMDTRFASMEARFDARLTAVGRELTEVKISVARLEGPPRRFIEAR